MQWDTQICMEILQLWVGDHMRSASMWLAFLEVVYLWFVYNTSEQKRCWFQAWFFNFCSILNNICRLIILTLLLALHFTSFKPNFLTLVHFLFCLWSTPLAWTTTPCLPETQTVFEILSFSSAFCAFVFVCRYACAWYMSVLVYAINYCSDTGCFINNFIIIDGYVNGGYILFKLERLNRLLDLCIVDSSLFALTAIHCCCFLRTSPSLPFFVLHCY